MKSKVLLLGPQAVRLGDADAATFAVDEAARALTAEGYAIVVQTPRLGAPVCAQGVTLWIRAAHARRRERRDGARKARARDRLARR